jgi:hypothetical protein
MTGLKALIAVCAAAVLLASVVSGQCPMAGPDMLYFTSGANWTCAANFDCMTTYCACVSGTLQANMSCTSYTAANASTVTRCLGQRVVCTLNASLNSSCSPSLKAAYPALYASTNRSQDNVTKGCMAGLCAELTAVSVMPSTINESDLAGAVCNLPGFPFPAPQCNGPLLQHSMCPMNAQSALSQLPESPQCVGPKNCQNAWCECNGMSVVNGSCQMDPSKTNVTQYERCSATLLACFVNQSIAMYRGNATNTSDPCDMWAQSVVTDYAQMYYSPLSDVQNSSLFRTCNALACTFERCFLAGTGDIPQLCSFHGAAVPPALPGTNNTRNDTNGGGDGVPQNPNCPVSPVSYFTNKPDPSLNCTPQLICETQWCNCNGFPLTSEHDCKFNITALNQSRFEQCGPQYVHCLTNASLAMYNPQAMTSPSSMTCASWAGAAVADYAQYYYSSTKPQERLTQACSSLLCNVEMAAFNQTGAVATLCGGAFANLPTPPFNPNNNSNGNNSNSSNGNGNSSGVCVKQGQTYFDKIPFGSCVTVEPCAKSLCSCMSGSYVGGGDCKFPQNPALATAQSCIATALSCIVNQALALYVPGTDAENPTVDTCVRWSVPIARDYQEYVAATNKQTTSLFATCNATTCAMVSSLNPMANFGASCGFAAVTSTPTFAEPNRCPFVCPDNTCARYLANCTCAASAALYNVSSQFDRTLTGFDVTNELNGLAYGAYRVLQGNCSTYDFNPYMRFRWVLSNSTNANVYSANGSNVRVPPLTMVPQATYTLTLTTVGLTESVTSVKTFTMTTVAPTPIVTITRNGGQMRVPNTNPVVIPANVIDPFKGSSPTFSWGCVAFSGTCPSLSNSTVAMATIAAAATTGSFNITFTFNGVSSSLNLTIVAGAIPVVHILQSSQPMVAVPAMYLPTQSVILGTAVNGYSDNVTYAWTVNGASKGTSKSLAIDASTLMGSTAQQLVDKAPVENTIVVRVTAVADAAVYGEASLVVVVAPAYSLTLSVGKSGDAAATSATGLQDDLSLQVTSNIDTVGVPYGLASQYMLLFYADKLRPLNTVPTGTAGAYKVQAPMPYSTTVTTGSVTVTFQAQLQLGGKIVSSVNQTFAIVRPDPQAAAQQQIKSAAAITDPTAAVAAATNIQTLMRSSTNATAVQEMAQAAVNMLANSVSDFSSQSTEQQAAIFETLSTAVGAQTDTTQKAVMQAKTLTLMTDAVSSSSFDPSNGPAALAALAQVSVKNSNAVIANLAQKMANDPTQPIGEVRKFSSGGVVIATVRQSAADLGGLAVSDGTSSLKMATGFTLPGVSDSSVVSVASATFPTNPYDADGGRSPDGTVVSFRINVDSAAKNVTGLSTPLSIGLSGAPGSSKCKYWDETTSAWSTSGVTTVVVSGVLTCQTTHLTAFASFSSSAAGVALSALVALAVLAVQLIA